MKRWILLGLMAVCVLVPVVFWAQRVTPGLSWSLYLYDAGRIAALMGFVFVFWQYVFSSKVRWIERDIGLDKLFGLHKTSGLVGLTLILTHPMFLFAADLAQGYNPLTLSPFKLVGILTMFLLIVAAGAALLYRKLKWKYETWKTIHWITYAILPLAFLHSTRLGSNLAVGPLRAFWYGLAAVYVSIVLSKLWTLVQVRRHPFDVVEVAQETHDVWSLHFAGRQVAYRPGQFLIVRLIRGGRVSEPHPFTISSSPTRERLSVSVKAVGDFTATIGDTKPSDHAYIDAPYGAFSYLNHDTSNLVFIAGGIGITPFMSMLRHMYDKKLERNVVVIWGNKTDKDIAFKDELDQMLAEMPTWKVVHVMSSQDDWPGEKGYVDRSLLARYLGDVRDPEVFVCGPPVMMTKVIQALREAGVPNKRIHYERFALR